MKRASARDQATEARVSNLTTIHTHLQEVALDHPQLGFYSTCTVRACTHARCLRLVTSHAQTVQCMKEKENPSGANFA
eukprot:6478586-Amphidinium_carterae.1